MRAPSLTLLLVPVALQGGCSKQAPFRPGACKDCNVVLISVDTLRRDKIGLYGYGHGTTPNLDAFFAGGVIYDNTVSPAPCTMPAVEQFLTARNDFRKETPRAAEVLDYLGYRTAAVVSHHFFRKARTGPPNPDVARGFGSFDVQAPTDLDHHRLTSRTATEVSDRALEWLEANGSDTFFLWLHYFDPHDPYAAPSEYIEAAATPAPVSGDRRALLQSAQQGDKKRHQVWARLGSIFNPEQVSYLRALYDAEIRYVDHEIGRVLSHLQESGLTKNTRVVFIADHGERLGEDEMWDHCLTLHAAEINVPMLTRQPGDSLRRVKVATSTIDWLPETLHQLGYDLPLSEVDGRALAHVAPDRKLVLAWRHERMVIGARWKLLAQEDGSIRLFDVTRDALDEHDLAAREPGVRLALAKDLEQNADDLDAGRELSEGVVEELRAVGYIQ